MATETAISKRPEDKVTRAEHTRNRPHYNPNVDIVETRDELLVLADMPGLEPGDVDVHFENGTLTIHGKVRERQTENTTYMLREYGVGDFHRSFEVSEAIRPDGITAEYADGLLTLHLPKTEAVKPRKITVRTK
jgi:HSP20 family protein